jgi:adenosylcobinamide-GDP ribazoletransferase
VLPLSCVRGVPAARGDGLGVTVAGSVSRPLAAGALAASTGIVATALAGSHLLAGVLGGAGARGSGWMAALGLAAVAVTCAVAAAAALLTRSVRRLGGVTGDVLGGCVEVATLAALVVTALTAGVLQPLR